MVQLRKLRLSEQDFDRFRTMISGASGFYFDRSKWDLLETGLAARAEAVGAGCLSDYYMIITESPDRELEFRRLLSQLSINDTEFFHGLPQFDALVKYVIPEIVQRKLLVKHLNLRFWSAGCSTGQETYSIAMAVLDVLDGVDGWNIRVLGTDLNDEALAVAEEGWYAEEDMAGVNSRRRDRYFLPKDGGFVVTEAVRQMVRFVSHNMVTDPLPLDVFGTCDVVFCRNVVVYFTHQTAKHVIEHFYDVLNPGGYLFLGHSESLWKMSAKYSLVELGDAFLNKKSLPRSMEGKRFIPDRRMRDMPLPPGVDKDRRAGSDRRSGGRQDNQS